MTAVEYVTSVIGKPYAIGGYGPDEFDCWGLVRDYFGRVDGIHIPHIDTTDVGLLGTCKRMGQTAGWVKIPTPIDGSAVLMSQGKAAHHVGIYINGGVIHAVDGVGVRWQSIIDIGYLWRVTGYYRRA